MAFSGSTKYYFAIGCNLRRSGNCESRNSLDAISLATLTTIERCLLVGLMKFSSCLIFLRFCNSTLARIWSWQWESLKVFQGWMGQTTYGDCLSSFVNICWNALAYSRSSHPLALMIRCGFLYWHNSLDRGFHLNLTMPQKYAFVASFIFSWEASGLVRGLFTRAATSLFFWVLFRYLFIWLSRYFYFEGTSEWI